MITDLQKMYKTSNRNEDVDFSQVYFDRSINEYYDTLEDFNNETHYFYLALLNDDKTFINEYNKHCLNEGLTTEINVNKFAWRIDENKYFMRGFIIEYDVKSFEITNIKFDLENELFDFFSASFPETVFDIGETYKPFIGFKKINEFYHNTFNKKYVLLFEDDFFIEPTIVLNIGETDNIYPTDVRSKFVSYPLENVCRNYPDDNQINLIHTLKQKFGTNALDFFISDEALKYKTIDELPINNELKEYIQNWANVDIYNDYPYMKDESDYIYFLNSFNVLYPKRKNMFIEVDLTGSFTDSVFNYDYLTDILKHMSEIEPLQPAFDPYEMIDYVEHYFDNYLDKVITQDKLEELFPQEYIAILDEDNLNLSSNYEDIIVKTNGFDQEMIDFDYGNNYDELIERKNKFDLFNTSIILRHNNELVGFVLECNSSLIDDSLIKYAVNKGIKLIFDNIIFNTNNFDLDYYNLKKVEYGFEKNNNEGLCLNKDNQIPMIISMDSNVDLFEIKDDTLLKIKQKHYNIQDEKEERASYIFEIDNRIKYIDKNALNDAYNVLIFYNGSMLDAKELLNNYDALNEAIIVCLDGIISKVNIKHTVLNEEKYSYINDYHDNEIVLNSLGAIIHKQIFTFVTCKQLQFLNYCGMNSFLIDEFISSSGDQVSLSPYDINTFIKINVKL